MKYLIIVLLLFASITATSAKQKNDIIFTAVERGDDRKVVQLLNTKNVNINAINEDGRTALHIAVIHRRHRILSLLLNNNPDLNIRDKVSGSTPLSYAVMGKDTEAVRILLERKPDLEIGTSTTPLLFKAIETGDPAIFRMLVDSGMNIEKLIDNYEGANSVNALMAAVRIGNPDIVKLILDKGTDVNHPDGFGDPAIIWAIYFNKPEMAQLLINLCDNINLNPDGINGSAMLLAKSKGYRELAELIGEKGGRE